MVLAYLDIHRTQAAIEHATPPIVFVKAGNLSYWQDNTSHAVALAGYDDEAVYLNDPAFATVRSLGADVALNANFYVWPESQRGRDPQGTSRSVTDRKHLHQRGTHGIQNLIDAIAGWVATQLTAA
jgi:uncharacterized protein YvpB